MCENQNKKNELDQHSINVLSAYVEIKKHFDSTKERSGSVQCSCGGTIKYLVASNGHIRAKCTICTISFIQ